MGERKNGFLKIILAYVIICEVIGAHSPRPEFTEPVPNVTVAVGQNASLPCRVKNLGNHKISWLHIDRQVILTIQTHVITRSERYAVTKADDNTWFLRVKKARQEDRGYYMCQINTNPIISQVGYLQVVAPPYFVDDESIVSSSWVNTREGSNLTLKCKARGYPEPTTVWKREDGSDIVLDRKTKGTIISGEKLKFRKLSRFSTGGYYCTASNGVPPSVTRKIFVNIQYPPVITVPKKFFYARLGFRVVLRCQTEGNPTTNSHWVWKNGDTNFVHTVNNTRNGYRTNMELIIQKVTKSDFGIYGCISENALGKAEGSISLHELEDPTTTTWPTKQYTSIKRTKTNGGTREKVIHQKSDKKDGRNNTTSLLPTSLEKQETDEQQTGLQNSSTGTATEDNNQLLTMMITMIICLAVA